MKIKVTEEFIGIVQEISDQDYDLKEWDEVSSSDMFQTDHFCGGFEGAEGEFTFSFFDESGDEYWFQFPLTDVPKILEGKIISLDCILAE